MNAFPISSDEYSVEEISYDDMMSILASQKQHTPVLQQLARDTATIDKAQKQKKYEDFSQRIAKNARQQLPDWLLNN